MKNLIVLRIYFICINLSHFQRYDWKICCKGNRNKNRQIGLHKIKEFLPDKRNTVGCYRQEKIFALCTSDIGLIYKIFKVHTIINKKYPNALSKMVTEGQEQQPRG